MPKIPKPEQTTDNSTLPSGIERITSINTSRLFNKKVIDVQKKQYELIPSLTQKAGSLLS